MTAKEKAQEIVNDLFERSLSYNDACIAGKYLVEQIIELQKDQANWTLSYWSEVQKEMSEIKI